MTTGSGGETGEATEEAWAEERLAEIRAVCAGIHELARGKQPGAVVAACLQAAAELIALASADGPGDAEQLLAAASKFMRDHAATAREAMALLREPPAGSA
jgi:hypothetical protein